MTATVMLSLPFPVSINALHRSVRTGRGVRVIRSKRYRAWIEEAGKEIQRQRPEKIAGPVFITIHLVAPDRRTRDADNLSKCTVDLLVAHQIIEADDSRIVRWVHPEWQDAGAPCTVTITACERTNPTPTEEAP